MRPASQLPGQYNVEIPDNIWPDVSGSYLSLESDSVFDLNQFQMTILQVFKQLDSISRAVLGAISVYIDEPRAFLPSLVEDGYSVLRLLNYPKVEQKMFPGSIRAAAHEDINFITLLVSATAPGLELLQRDGTWMPIVAPEGAIIIDSTDMLANLRERLIEIGVLSEELPATQ